jgi:flagellar basal-body rod modification protein FlgD
MSVSSVSSSSSSANALSSTLTKTDDMDKQTFLNLLTTQLKYQDPMNPMENTEFVAQLAQFSSLEQLYNINESLNTNSLYTQAMQNSMLPSLIGKSITSAGNSLDLQEGSPAEFAYSIAEDADVTVTITNAAGDKIKTLEIGKQSAGMHECEWDGTNVLGKSMAAGEYYVKVVGKNSDGEDKSGTTYVHGTVTSVRFVDGATKVMIGNAQVSPNDIIEVTE